MAIEIKMPKLGLSMVTGKVGKWLIQEGKSIQKGDALLEIMTDKITNVIEAPADGILLKIAAVEGDELPIGAVLGVIGAAGETIASFATDAVSLVEPIIDPTIVPPARTLPMRRYPAKNRKCHLWPASWPPNMALICRASQEQAPQAESSKKT